MIELFKQQAEVNRLVIAIFDIQKLINVFLFVSIMVLSFAFLRHLKHCQQNKDVNLDN